MFSVNIDKLVTMTELEKECYSKAVNTIIDKMAGKAEADSEKFSIGVVGDAVSVFKMAAQFTETGKNVLFIDGDLSSEVFLGKYRLGKELEGLSDCIMSAITGEALIKKICITNNNKLDIIFSGNIESSAMTVSGVFSAGENYISNMINECLDKYDTVICLSDDSGNIAKYCDAAVIITDDDTFENKEKINGQIKTLDGKGCDVLGVIINE